MKPGPYDPCSCGSGKKAKFCCGVGPATAVRVPAPAASRETDARAGSAAALSQHVQQALAAHRTGQYAQAERIYRSVIAAEPRHADATHLLGVLAYQSGQFAPAIEFIGRAIAINPQAPEYHANLGHALKDSGNLPAAEASYRKALQLRAPFPEVSNNLGLVLQQQGRLEEAVSCFEQALAADPQFSFALMNLGALRHVRGELDAAQACYLRALAIDPSFAQAANNLGTVLQARGDTVGARVRYEEALRLQPDYGDALSNLGAALEMQGDFAGAANAYSRAIALGGKFDGARVNLGAMLRRRGELDQAIRQFSQVLARDPLDAPAHLNLGVARQDQGRLVEALSHYLIARAQDLRVQELESNIASALVGLGSLDRALALLRRVEAENPQSAQVRINIGSVLYMQGRHEEAFEELRRAVALEPENANANWNLAMTQLATGRFEEMWKTHEWRLVRERMLLGKPWRPFAHRAWKGEPLGGETLLIYLEQGVGDEIWIAGMFDDVLAGPGRDGRVVIECRKKLVPLFARSFPAAEVVALVDPPDAKCMEGVDLQIAGGSLGQFVRPNLESFPKRQATGGAYLFADPAREKYWRERLASQGSGLRVGVSWRGSSTRGERALYYTRLSQWAEVFKVPGVRFINLQYDECETELAEVESAFGITIERYPEVDMFDDLDETAALMRGLDLVISASTTVSILSAALGVQTWQMNYGIEWQLHGQAHSPWYPAMRNYPRRWDQQWEEILERIASDLSALAGVERTPRAPKNGAIELDGGSRFGDALRLVRDGDANAAAALSRILESEKFAGAAVSALLTVVSNRAGDRANFDARLSRVSAEAANNLFEFALYLGNAYRLAGRPAQARPLIAIATGINGNDAAAWEALGLAALDQKDFDEAARALEESLRCDPTLSHLKAPLAEAIDKAAMREIAADRNESASILLARAAALSPDSAEIQFHFGCALQELGRYDDATAAYRRTAELQPGFAPVWNNLANTLRACGRLDESIECFRRALALDGDLDSVRSNLLLTMNYAEGIDPARFLAEHLEYGKRIEAHSPVAVSEAAALANLPDPARRLRVGYVSGDFREHPITLFLEPILAHHDRANFEVFCYACSTRTDEFTNRIRSQTDGWRSLAGLPDDAAAALIRGDAIDILVDLAGHTGLTRLPVFARKPAPVQISYLGYPATTGLRAVDYKIVDNFTAPTGSGFDSLYTETLWRLNGPMWAFAPNAGMPAVSALPLAQNGYVTFASFNTVVKVGDSPIRAWAEIMLAVPNSRLMLATVPAGETRSRLTAKFAELGIDASRLSFHPRLKAAAFWELYSQADIALDTFPCNGGTTTFETLWMGVPVVALAGSNQDTLVSHVSAGILRGLGCDELIGSDASDYVRRTVHLAQDGKKLAQLRAGLRDRLAKSAYMDHAQFVADLERSYRTMWQRWCVQQLEIAR